VEQDTLVPFADPENFAHLRAGESFHIAKQHDLSLA
jgi:hypothetical protein